LIAELRDVRGVLQQVEIVLAPFGGGMEDGGELDLT